MFDGISDSNKLLFFNLEARQEMKKGVDALFSAVKVTMGPKGNNVVIERPMGTPILTKDGVTVASAINLKARVPNLGVQMVKEAAARTADTAGDGTTTATVLAHAIFEEGMKRLGAGASPVDLKKGIDKAVESLVEELSRISFPVTSNFEISQVASISANGEKEIGDLIAQAMEKVGKDGVVSVEEAKGFKTYLSVVEGMQINRGYLSPYFINKPEKMQVEFEKPYILITNRKITNIREILPLLEKIVNENKPLLIIADEVDGDAMQGLVVNHTKGMISVCAITAPEYGEPRTELLGDLKALLGGEVITHASGHKLEEIQIEMLGKCDKVIVTKKNTTFVGGKGTQESIQNQIDLISERIKNPTLSEDERAFLKNRLSRLKGGVSVIHVGGSTEIELRERKDRVDDALHATQAALEEGILPGGGVSLAKVSKVLDSMIEAEKNADIRSGIEIVKLACFKPLKIIASNAGAPADYILQMILDPKHSFAYGWNAYNNTYCDMIKEGIIDPSKVTRCALDNAASAAGMMLTVECVMIEDKE